VCGGTRFALHGHSRDEHALHQLQLRCHGCGLLVGDPPPSPSRLAAFYAHTYYDELWPDPTLPDDYPEYEMPLMRRLWVGFAPPPGGRAVEVGCGWGRLLRRLRADGFRVSGCEVSPRAAAACREDGLDVVEGESPGLPFAPSSFDLVVSLQVIEHVLDPRGFVAELASLARVGGVLVVATEDAFTCQTAFERALDRLRGRPPVYRSSTDHTVLLGADHLRRLLGEAGCDPVRVAAYSRVPPGERPHWRIYKGLFRALDRLSGHGEYLIAVGRKR
jgi:SAM-dependent methyltransferase